MAEFYRKRRTKAGPSKNEEKVERGRQAASMARSGGVLATRFPAVSRISVRLEFLSPKQHVLGQETRVFGPQDVCDFTAPCPGQCGVGSFNLAAKIEKLVEARESSSEASGKCQEPLYAGAASLCGCELKCKVELAYVPAPAATPAAADKAPLG